MISLPVFDEKLMKKSKKMIKQDKEGGGTSNKRDSSIFKNMYEFHIENDE